MQSLMANKEREIRILYELILPNGGKRFYQIKKDDSFSFQQFLLTLEIKPNGNKIFYNYDQSKRLISIKSTNPAENKIYAQINFHYYGEINKNHNFKVTTSDKKLLKYQFWKHKSNNNKEL